MLVGGKDITLLFSYPTEIIPSMSFPKIKRTFISLYREGESSIIQTVPKVYQVLIIKGDKFVQIWNRNCAFI